jgi:hypothetical protein
VKEDETDVNTAEIELSCYLLHAGFSLGSFFHPEEGDMFLRNVC